MTQLNPNSDANDFSKKRDPYLWVLRSFQGFITKEIPEFHSKQHMIFILEPKPDRERENLRKSMSLNRRMMVLEL